jgi:hypothetical protein
MPPTTGASTVQSTIQPADQFICLIRLAVGAQIETENVSQAPIISSFVSRRLHIAHRIA